MPASRRNEILIIQTAFLGDLLLTIPLLKAVREMWPECHLSILCRSGFGSLLLRYRLVDEVIEVNKATRTSWRDAVDRLKKREFAYVFCPHESFRSALLAARLKGQIKIGYRRFFNRFIFSPRIVRPMQYPEVIRQLAMLAPVSKDWALRLQKFAEEWKETNEHQGGALAWVPDWASMQVEELKEIRENMIKRRGSARKPVAFLAPGSVWPTKMWTANGYAELARALINKNYEVFLMGSSSEISICEGISGSVPGVQSLAGQLSLVEVAERLARADILICNDSGAMHLAALSGVPTVSIFGPTVIELGYRPWQNQARIVELPLACRPCGKHGAKKCPLGTHACMKDLGADFVLRQMDALLDLVDGRPQAGS